MPKTYSYKDKLRANSSVKKAIQQGTLTRPDDCETCKMVGTVVAHHTDYSKPLEVMWLCRKCHVQWHKRNGYAETTERTPFVVVRITEASLIRLKVKAAKARMPLYQYIDSIVD